MKLVSRKRTRFVVGSLLAMLAVIMFRVSVPVQAAAENPLVAAAKKGDLAAVRRLVAAGANVNVTGTDGATPLIWAAYNTDAEMTQVLLAAKAKVDTQNRYGVTALLTASRTGDLAVMEQLLKAGANPNVAPPEAETPLMAAARTGKVEAIKLLLAKGANINGTDAAQDQSPLMWAAAEGHAAAVTTLLEAGAKPNLKAHVTSLTQRSHADHPTGGFTALMWAARNGHADVINVLAKAGANLNETNGDGATATIIAIQNDRLDIASQLIDLGSDPNDGSLYHAVDMHDATTDTLQRDGSLLRWDHPNKVTTMDLVKKLLAKGADPNKPFVGQLHSVSMANPDFHNANAFYRASIASDTEALKVLLATKKVNLEWSPVAPAGGGRGGAGNVGKTALMVAANGGKGMTFGGGPGYGRLYAPIWREAGSRLPLDSVKLLVEAGVDLNAQAVDDGNTAAHQAAQRSDLETLKYLASKGAALDVYNWTGQTALDIAEANAETARTKPKEQANMTEPDFGPKPADAQEVVDTLRTLMKLPPSPNAGKPAVYQGAK